MKLAPARLEPIFVPRIWGAKNLSPLFPEHNNEPEPMGEAWLTGNECRFATGEFSGRKLGEVWPSLAPDWTGTRLRRLGHAPLLVKFIFPEEKLSLQVHPTDAYAAKHEAAAGGAGKTEMWYVISARDGAEVLVGLREGTTRDSFARAIADGSAEECLARVPVRAGDAIFVPAGTAHSILPGVVLCEIQEYSDVTYRVFDYDRVGADGKPRALHIQQALDVLQFGQQSGGRCEPVTIQHGAATETFYVACGYFAVERWEFRQRIAAVTDASHFDALIFLSGSGQVEFPGGELAYAPAQSWLLPASLGAYMLSPKSPTTLLRAYVPDLNDFVKHLADQRVAEPVWARVVHP